MVGVNATRGGMARKLSSAVEGAELIGFNTEGEACVWSGGYSFNVYDAARDWQEVRHFTDGRMVDWSDEQQAKERMESEGFEVIG